MAVAHDRSMRAELAEGASDGSIRKRHQDRGGIVESTGDSTHDELVQSVGAGVMRGHVPYGDGEQRSSMPAVLRRR